MQKKKKKQKKDSIHSIQQTECRNGTVTGRRLTCHSQPK